MMYQRPRLPVVLGLCGLSLLGATGQEGLTDLKVPQDPPPIRFTKKELSPGIVFQAQIIRNNSGYDVDILSGGKLTNQNATRLIRDHQYLFLMNGTFYGSGRSMGDIAGNSLNDPSKSFSKPFRDGNPRLQDKIAHRYCLIQNTDSTWSLQLRRDLSWNGQKLPLGVDVSQYFPKCLGGLAYVNLRSPAIQKTLTDPSKRGEFVHAFNIWNGSFNRQDAYAGLDGYRPRSRTAIVLGTERGTDRQSMILITIGSGKNSLKGVTIYSLLKNCLIFAKESGIDPAGVGITDGGGSVSFGTKQLGVNISEASTYTVLAMRAKS